MRGDLGRSLATAAVALTCLVGWMVAGANGALATNSRIAIFFIANVIVTFDMIDLIGRIWVTRLHGACARGPSLDLGLPEISQTEMTMTLSPYALIASIHDSADDIDRFLSAMQPLKEYVWLIDDGSNDDTLLRVRRLGWNCMAGGTNRHKPGALCQLVKALPPEIKTVVVLDPDVRWAGDPGQLRGTLERVISDLQRVGAAALSPRFNARRRGWLSECQALEYELACGLGRKSLGDLSTNSGVSIYRRAALEDALSRHSLSVYAEDFENSVLLLAAGERIYYDDRLVFITEAKNTWKELLSQRIGWAFGCGKVFLERWPLLIDIARRSPFAAYQYLFYLGIGGIALLPLKLVSVSLLIMSLLSGIDGLLLTHVIAQRPWNQPILFELWWIKSAVVMTIACIVTLPRGARLRHIGTIPFYGFYVLWLYIPITIGLANVVSLRLFGRRLYSDHYDANPRLCTVRAPRPALRS